MTCATCAVRSRIRGGLAAPTGPPTSSTARTARRVTLTCAPAATTSGRRAATRMLTRTSCASCRRSRRRGGAAGSASRRRRHPSPRAIGAARGAELTWLSELATVNGSVHSRVRTARAMQCSVRVNGALRTARVGSTQCKIVTRLDAAGAVVTPPPAPEKLYVREPYRRTRRAVWFLHSRQMRIDNLNRLIKSSSQAAGVRRVHSNRDESRLRRQRKLVVALAARPQ